MKMVLIFFSMALAGALWAQRPTQPPPMGVPIWMQNSPRAKPTPQPTATPTPAPAADAGAAQPAASPSTKAAGATPAGGVVLNVQGASLIDIVDMLARQLKINYILDPGVKGSVIINTYGEMRNVDARALLETILRINGASIVQVGDIYRIVPVADVSRLPVEPQVGAKTFPDDERMMLNLVFLKYATVGELFKLLQPFVGEGGTMTAYEPANLLLLLDNSRNMRRTMDLISLFDNDALASQRVRLFTVKESRPSDLAHEMETVMKAVSLAGKESPVKFLPIDRINTIVAIASNPGVFDQVEVWLKKLDIAQKSTAGTTSNYVYRVVYGCADSLASAIMQLYVGYGYGGGMSSSSCSLGMGIGGLTPNGLSGGGYGGGGYGNGYGGGGMYGGGGYGGGGMYGGGGYGGGGYGGGGYGGNGYGGNGYGGGGMYGAQAQSNPMAQAAKAGGTAGASPDLTGSYLGNATQGTSGAKVPRVIPNPLDNTLLIQATPQDYQEILKLLRQLDVPPRQVLVEAKIYEVDLTGAFASGVQAYLQNQNSTNAISFSPTATLQAISSGTNLSLTAGMLVGASRQLAAVLTASEQRGTSKLISAPRLIATDSIPATMNVGDEVPTLNSQAASGITNGGTSQIVQGIQNVQTGVTLTVLARVTPAGIVTLGIQQNVSTPIAPAASSSIQSPSFSQRSFSTQVTVQDGDTIAIGGIISDSNTYSTSGIPLLSRIPWLGAAFGSKSITKSRTEMVVLMTPHVIYDTNQIVEASEELKSGLNGLRPLMKQ